MLGKTYHITKHRERAWGVLAKSLLVNKLPLEGYISYVLRKNGPTSFSGVVTNESTFQSYKEDMACRKPELRDAVKIQLFRLNTMSNLFTEEEVLLNRTENFSAVFRYAMGNILKLPRVVEEFREEAENQLKCEPRYLDPDVLGYLLPAGVAS